MARITAGMESVMRRVSYQGTLAQFFEFLRTDPSFAPASAQALADRYAEIGRRVDAALPRLFDQRPKTPLAIRPTPAVQAPNDAAARYTDGSIDTGKPGVFYFNTINLATRRIWGAETLYLHEAMPGHHMQSALAAENLTLP